MLNNWYKGLCRVFVNKVVRRIHLISVITVLRRFQQMSAITDKAKSPNLLYETLERLSANIADYFKDDESEYGQRLHTALLSITEIVSRATNKVEKIRHTAPKYDFDEVTIGNGYRSFVLFMDNAIAHAIQTCQLLDASKQSMLFRKTHFTKEVEAILQVISALDTCFELLQNFILWSKDGELFPDEEQSTDELIAKTEIINQYCFYGRCLGLQFNESIRTILKTISISMATFSEGYYSKGGLAATANVCLATGKFFMEPEARARRIVHISQHAGIDFIKAFWKLSESELLSKISTLGSAVEVNKLISITPEILEIETTSKQPIVISPPNCYIGLKALNIRLLSTHRRKGMYGETEEGTSKTGQMLPPSPGLLLHVHGGGFVAQTSKTQLVYLESWVQSLNVPVISIDYSLAPEAPFPRALEEVIYTYCWCLKNLSLLGTTGQRIVFAGDSAGANLILGALQRIIAMGLPIPNGVFVAYVPVIVSFVPSPSRLLSLMDPVLPLGFMLRCLKAYACPDSNAIGHTTPSPKMSKGNFSDDSFEEVTEEEVQQLTSRSELQSSKEKKSSGTYVLDSEVRNGEHVAIVRTIDNASQDSNGIFGSAYSLLSKLRPHVSPHVLDNAELATPSEDFKFTVAKDSLLSPYWAPDEILRKFPPVSLCSAVSDPCLDDTVMFAKKLRSLGNVVRLDVIDGLPHGFLNFCRVNTEAEEASKLCVKRIKDLLDLSRIAPTKLIIVNSQSMDMECDGLGKTDIDDEGGLQPSTLSDST